MSKRKITTTLQPTVELEVDENEFTDLRRLGLLKTVEGETIAAFEAAQKKAAEPEVEPEKPAPRTETTEKKASK